MINMLFPLPRYVKFRQVLSQKKTLPSRMKEVSSELTN
ncbi:hypothetical protein FH5_05056 [Priestia endophytica]|nr:hypothetical protein FH5_05056 [Priestia endophytica]